MTERRCPGCHVWYPKEKGECPECGKPPHRHNKWLATAALNSNLYQMAEQSVAQDKAVGRRT